MAMPFEPPGFDELAVGGRGRVITFVVEFLELRQIHSLDVTANAAFGESECHPGFKAPNNSWLDFRVLEQVIIQAVRKSIHQILQPGGTRLVILHCCLRVDEELHAQILVDLGFALRLGQAAHSVNVVRFYAIEVVLGLRVEGSENRVGICSSVDVGDAPVVPDDSDSVRLAFPTGDFGRPVRLKGESGYAGKEQGEQD